MKPLKLSDVPTEFLNYLIMRISHGADVGASLENIVAELNRRARIMRDRYQFGISEVQS